MNTFDFTVSLIIRVRSGIVLDWRPKGRRVEPHRGHCVVSLSKTH